MGCFRHFRRLIIERGGIIAKQVPWNKIIVERFISLAMLTKDEEEILRTRVDGWTITKQSLELGMSESKINKIIARLKVKYDKVQKYDPLLPPRTFSAKETYMDEH